MYTIFLPYTDPEQIKGTVENLKNTGCPIEIVLVSTAADVEPFEGLKILHCPDGMTATSTLKKLAETAARSKGDTVFVYNKLNTLLPGYNGLERFDQVLNETGSMMVYADYYSVKANGNRESYPVIDLQEGALRDDFNFGSLLAFDKESFVDMINELEDDYKAAGMYDLRLHIMREGLITHVGEFLYTDIETDARKSGEKIFDYVDPRNRASQIEMEKACTEHLKAIGGWLSPEKQSIDFSEEQFPVEASVIIPVRNRVRTIKDAVDSVLMQKANFKFNVIVVDNHSTDGTTEALQSYTDPRVVHVVPDRDDLGIGGCWNYGAARPECGKFALQLDSDDLYSDENVMQRIVDEFYKQNCAMLIGSYMLTDINKNMLPPGVIDHREWTDDNGANNALRINGLGAPRCFYTPVLREYKLPNCSYGEDYALGLQISRTFRIGRIYDVLYLCRRWEDNSDAALDINKMNAHNRYKDSIRTQELLARILMNEVDE